MTSTIKKSTIYNQDIKYLSRYQDKYCLDYILVTYYVCSHCHARILLFFVITYARKPTPWLSCMIATCQSCMKATCRSCTTLSLLYKEEIFYCWTIPVQRQSSTPCSSSLRVISFLVFLFSSWSFLVIFLCSKSTTVNELGSWQFELSSPWSQSAGMNICVFFLN